MNIFFLDENVNENAKAHCDTHVFKMALEAVQMLYAVWWLARGTDFVFPELDGVVMPPNPYSKTHSAHPMTLWSSTCAQNYQRLIDMAKALLDEYHDRYNKEKPSVVQTHLLYLEALGFPTDGDVDMTSEVPASTVGQDKGKNVYAYLSGCSPVPLCFPAEHVMCLADSPDQADLFASYRSYYMSKPAAMKRPMKWRQGTAPAPDWFTVSTSAASGKSEEE